MTTAIIAGGHRPNGETPRIANWFAAKLKGRGQDSFVLDLTTEDLPFWDDGLWGQETNKAKWESLWAPWQQKLQAADDLIILCPEYNGMAPSKLINFLHLVTKAEVAHKPTLAVSISSGINGAYPVAELRAFGAKNNRILWLPEHLILRNAAKILQGEEAADEHEETLRQRIDWTLNMLQAYSQALKPLRQTENLIDDRFPNGM